MKKKKKIGLALGGGGARGFAHLGVLHALKNAGIEVDVFSGTSMGAIIAVAHLQRKTLHSSEISLKRFVNHYSRRLDAINFTEASGYEKKTFIKRIGHTITNSMKFMSLAVWTNSNDGKILKEITNDFIFPCNLEDLPKKVFICAIDVVSGQGVLMNTGNARKSVRASISIAGCFPGVPFGERILVDASAIFPVPIHAFQFEPVDFILACDVGVSIPSGYRPTSSLDLLLREYDLMCNHAASEVKYCSDYVIRPELENVHWTDFRKLEFTLKCGYEACEKALPEIEKLLKDNKPNVPISERPWHNAGYSCDPVIIDSFPSINEEEEIYGKARK